MRKVVMIFGTRPKAIKFAPVYRELARHPDQFQSRIGAAAQGTPDDRPYQFNFEILYGRRLCWENIMVIFSSRFCGNGFGNEFLWIAKALICSNYFKMKYWREIGPRHLLSRWVPPYNEIFPEELHNSSLCKYVFEYLIYKKSYKVMRFEAEELISTGEVRIELAVKKLFDNYKINMDDKLLVVFDKMRPCLESVAHESEYLKSLLFRNGWLKKALDKRKQVLNLNKRKLIVGLHIRLDDFNPPLPLGQQWPEGVDYNIQIPIDWYTHICGVYEAEFPGQVEYLISSNGKPEQLSEIINNYPCKLMQSGIARSSNDIVDLFMLSECDMIVSSVSTFCGWAILFSNKPFIWYRCVSSLPKKILPRDPVTGGIDKCIPMVLENKFPENIVEYCSDILTKKNGTFKVDSYKRKGGKNNYLC